MNIGDKLRKAAGLFVQMPDPVSEATEPTAPAAAGTAAKSDTDLDGRLAAMDAAMQGIKAGKGDSGSPRTIEQIVRESDGPNLDEIRMAAGTVASNAKGTVDFAALYTAAALPSTPFTAEQTIEMIVSLPQLLPLEMKRQTIQVTLASIGKAIGATPETIIADTSRKLAALAAYADDNTKHTDEFVSGSEADIAFLLSQVEEKRTAILAARQQQAAVQQQCSAEADRLDDVLEFFSLDVPPSRHAPAAGETVPPAN